MRIFFSGTQAYSWQSGWQRCATFKELGYEILEFHQEEFQTQPGMLGRVAERMFSRPFQKVDIERFNREFLRAVTASNAHVAWLEWPQMLLPETLLEAKRTMPGCIFISFQDDNPFGLRRYDRPRWQHFLENIPLFDLNFVKRPTDLIEYRKRNAAKVELFVHGYYGEFFQPRENGAGNKHDVVFVGTPIDDRVKTISELMRRHDIPVEVYGNSWNRKLIYYRNHPNFHPQIVGHEYASLLSRSKISLGFVSSSNLDEYTMRSFEIPACRGFFLAQRTPTHLQLYEEGKEAEYFSSTEECADKIRYYLNNDTARQKIAEAGYQRCLRSDYSLRRRLRDAMTIIEGMRN